MLYRLLRSDPKTHSGNPSELVICIEPEPLQSKMELLPTNFLLHIQHFLSPAPLSRFVFSLKQNGATADELPPSYSAFSEPCSIEPVCFTTREK